MRAPGCACGTEERVRQMSEERAPCGPGTITGCEGFPRLATCCLERSWEGGARLLDCALDLECERVQFWGEATTDDEGIATVARAFDAEVVMRPSELATDTATSESALRHFLDSLHAAEDYDPDLIVFLQATAPIRRPFDVDRAIATLQAAGADSLLSVVPSHSFLWRHTDEGSAEPVNYDYRSRPRRQDLEPQYAENGSIYVFKPWVLREHDNRLGGKIVLYEMDAWSGIDIDAPHDLALCEWIMSRRLGQKG